MPSRPKTDRREVPPIIQAEMYGMRRAGASFHQISQLYPLQHNCALAESHKKHESLP